MGLARIVESEFGKKFSKYNQESAWSQRPLRRGQIHYAALDAVASLHLFLIINKKFNVDDLEEGASLFEPGFKIEKPKQKPMAEKELEEERAKKSMRTKKGICQSILIHNPESLTEKIALLVVDLRAIGHRVSLFSTAEEYMNCLDINGEKQAAVHFGIESWVSEIMDSSVRQIVLSTDQSITSILFPNIRMDRKDLQ